MGFTLAEVAIASLLVAGLTTGLAMAVRYVQMIQTGKAAGEQLATIRAGTDRYLQIYGQQIAAIDRACARLGLVAGSGATEPPISTNPDCQLKKTDEGGVQTVLARNGYQPEVSELVALGLVRASDQLLLPHTSETVRDTTTNAFAKPRIAVWISPLAANAQASSKQGSTFSLAIPTISSRSASSPATGQAAAFNLPPTLFGVNCYQRFTGDESARPNYPVFYDPQDPRKVLPIYSGNAAVAAIGAAKPYFRDGMSYCRFMQEKYGEGIVGSDAASSPGGGTDTQASGSATLQAVVFNTQPYYYGEHLPTGASAQIGAALEAVGYAGRLSMVKSKGINVDGRKLKGLYGKTDELDNPIVTTDPAGVPGILAAVSVVSVQGGATENGSGGGGQVTWDAGGHNITNAGLLQGAQVGTHTAVIGTQSSIPLEGRPYAPVLAVNGDMVMGQSSTLLTNQVEAKSASINNLTARSLNLTGRVLLLGQTQTGQLTNNTVYVSNSAALRVPRVMPRTRCAVGGAFDDVAASYNVLIERAGSRLWTRFLLLCTASVSSGGSWDGYVWTSPEYEEALTKYPPSQYTWAWQQFTNADKDAYPTPIVE